MQYIQFFGPALKIDNDFDIDMLEEECLKPQSDRLAGLGLIMLKWVSSHRGLTQDIFDEYTRRQYLAKAPHLNPFGEEEDALKFSEMDVFTKLKVLHQLSVWTFHNPDRIREKMEESTDKEQASWRIEPFGEDREGRHYFLLDDNRLYRLTEPSAAKPPPPKAKAKANSKPKKAGNRSSKRQKTSVGDTPEPEDESNEKQGAEQADNGLGGAKWECVAVNLDEYRIIIERFRKGKNQDEREMVYVLEDQAMPELLRAEESKARKELKRQKELESLSKMATAKRSSRLADKQEKQKQEDEVKTLELKRQEEVAMAHKEQDRQMKQERDRESRMMTREQRIRDRDMRRILHEEELSKLQERSQSVDSSDAARISERNRATMLQRKQQDLAKIKEEEQDDWDFDCEVCGVHGKNIDDGTHSIACDGCGVWQHSSCHNITPQQAEKEAFKFVCLHCKKPKSSITLKFPGQSSPADIKPLGKGPQVPSSSSPPMGVFKATPPTANGPLPTKSHGYPQQVQAMATSQMSSRNQSPLIANGYPDIRTTPPYSQPQPSPSSSSHPYASHPNSSVHPPRSPSKHHPQSTYSPYQYPQAQQHSQLQPNPSDAAPPLNGAPLSFQLLQPSNAKPAQTPISNGASAHPRPSFPSQANHAPAPSLSATQGNTSLRFSPTSQPPPSSNHHKSTNLANSPHAAQAYSPNSVAPQHGAVSPIKHASSPHSSFGVKPSSSFGQHIAAPHSPRKSTLPPPHLQQTPGQLSSPGMSGNLDGVPTLSPSVNANGTSNTVPVKKTTPVKSPVLSPALQPPLSMVNVVGDIQTPRPS